LRLLVGVLPLLVACGRSDTGIEIFMRVGSLDYDELRLGVTRASADPGHGPAGETLVDPANDGRFLPPFRPGDQSVVVFLSDALDGASVHCEASALRGGAAVASGASDVTVERHKIKSVDIMMGQGPPPTGGAGSGGTGGPGGPAGGTGGGGTGGGPGPGMGGTSAPGRANGESCSVASECVSSHCIDGVCCEEDCHNACRSCALPDTKGLCRPVPAGTPDPRAMCNDKGAASCQTNGLCDVAGDCAVYPAGTACAPAGCADMNTAVVPARTCDGAGKCKDQPKMKCPEDAACAGGECG